VDGEKFKLKVGLSTNLPLEKKRKKKKKKSKAVTEELVNNDWQSINTRDNSLIA